MNGKNPLRASDLDIVDAYEPTLTTPMAKLFQGLVDRAAASIIYPQVQEQIYANQHTEPADFAVGGRLWGFPSLSHPKPQAQAHGDATAARLGTNRGGFRCSEVRYEVEYILNLRTRNGLEEYSEKWKGQPHEDATWEPVQHLDMCNDLLCAIRPNRTRHWRLERREA
ncbi:hypothetical protein Efla_005737 [Eimeria flavescens]